jgi:mRNA-binding protein PUF3
LQQALEHVLVEQQEDMVEELRPHLMQIMKDQNGNHVVQKVIATCPRMCVPFMMDNVRGQISSLSAHNYGCRVIQRMLENGTEVERRELLEEIHACSSQLILDQYGNYVAQHIVISGAGPDRSRMIQAVIDDLVNYSKHKFASNVVEKCIKFGTTQERSAVKAKLMTPLADGSSLLNVLGRDQYGSSREQRKKNSRKR